MPPIHPPILTEAQRFEAFGQPGVARHGGDVVLAPVKFLATEGERTIWVNELVVPMMTAVSAVMRRHDYKLDGRDTGSYSFRKIGGTSRWSAHAWAAAIDVNWLENPYGRELVTDMPQAMRDEIEALVTVSGAPVARGGWDWDRNPSTSHSFYDAMHIDCIAFPADLATGIIDPNWEDSDMIWLIEGQSTRMVWRFRMALIRWRVDARGETSPLEGYDTDGEKLEVYDAAMAREVAEFQRIEGMPSIDGSTIAGQTAVSLFEWLESEGTPNDKRLDVVEEFLEAEFPSFDPA